MTTRDEQPPTRRRLVAPRVATAAAGLLVLVALLAPHDFGQLRPAGFLTLPAEALIGVAVLVALPTRAARIVAIVAGAVLGLLTVLKLLDLGFSAALARPFDPFSDWSLFGPAQEFLAESFGRAGAIAAAIAVVLLFLALPVVLAWSVLRLTRVGQGHRTGAMRTAGALGLVWIVLAAFGVHLVPGVPVAGWPAAGLAVQHATQARADLVDQDAFERAAAVDAVRETPAEQLLTWLRGKDVLIVFVESYGRDALENPAIAPGVDALLRTSTDRLTDAGFSARSAFMTSPTTGGASWLAHSTLQSGLWIDSQRRYHSLMASDRFTLAAGFNRAGWRTVGVMPANNRDWPDGKLYGYDAIYDARTLGYQGPRFSFSSIPDQYSLAQLYRRELATPGRAPVMAEVDLVSSHAPWDPIPSLMDWSALGDGSGIGSPETSVRDPETVYDHDPTEAQDDYRRTLEYSLGSTLSFVETYGNDDLVVVLLGDHQPAPIITGPDAPAEVPITVIARDPAVFDRIADWGWSPGLKPAPAAPLWPMDAFRDRFLRAFGPQ